MDTANRVFQLGKKMALRIGESAPLPGVQSVEFNSTQPVERRGEYDSGEQVAESGVTEYTGTVEFLTSERGDIYQQLMGKSAATLSDVSVEGFGRPSVILGIWDRRKTKYISGAYAGLPLYNTFPFSTQLAQAATVRLEFQPSIFALFPFHAVGQDRYDSAGINNTATGSQMTGSNTSFTLSRTAKQLSHVFGQRYVLDAITVETLTNGAKDFKSIASTISSTTATTCVFNVAPASTLTLYIVYAYLSTAENSGYAGSTL